MNKRALISLIVSTTLLLPALVYAGTHKVGEWLSDEVGLVTSKTYQDIGGEIDTKGCNDLAIALSLTLESGASVVNVRALGKWEDSGVDEYSIPLTSPSGDLTLNGNDYIYSLNGGASEKVILKWELDDTVPIVQIQAAGVMSASKDVTVSSMYIIENR